jgi:hypothetical protein
LPRNYAVEFKTSGTASRRRILVVLQADEHLPHALLAAALAAATLALAAQIHQLGDPLPARTARRGVLTLRQKLLGLLGDLGLLSVDLAVVALVEAVDVLLGGGDRLFLLLAGGFVATGDVGVALLSPGADGFGLFFGLDGIVVGVAAAAGGVCDGAAGTDVLEKCVSTRIWKSGRNIEGTHLVLGLDSGERALKVADVVVVVGSGGRLLRG